MPEFLDPQSNDFRGRFQRHGRNAAPGYRYRGNAGRRLQKQPGSTRNRLPNTLIEPGLPHRTARRQPVLPPKDVIDCLVVDRADVGGLGLWSEDVPMACWPNCLLCLLRPTPRSLKLCSAAVVRAGHRPGRSSGDAKAISRRPLAPRDFDLVGRSCQGGVHTRPPRPKPGRKAPLPAPSLTPRPP
jgi:hypothetical protein